MSLDITLYYDGNEIYSWNITHNLNRMAIKCGMYHQLWRPEEWDMDKDAPVASEMPLPVNCIRKAYQLVPHVEAGIAELKSNPDYYKLYDAPNGWGTYDQFIPCLEELLMNLTKMPNADISVSR